MTDPAPAVSLDPTITRSAPRSDGPSSPADNDRVQRSAAVVSLTTLVVSLANYAFSLVLIRLLVVADYVAYASIQSLLLVLGAGGMAAIPWAVARHVALNRTARAAGEALGFGLVASVVQGVVFAGLSFAIVAPASGAQLGMATGAAAFALSVVAAPLGVLQGQGRLVAISVLRLVETIVRIVLSLALIVAVSADPLSPIAGFIVGSAILTAAALVICRRTAFPLRRPARAVYRGLLRHSALLGVAQLSLAALGTIDTVVIALTPLASIDARDYQVAALLGRVPLFVGAAVALTYYPQVSSAVSIKVAQLHQAHATRLIVLIGLPAAVLLATTPAWVLEIVSPGRADQVSALLPFTAMTGATVAIATVLACAHQARERYRRLFVLLLPIAVLQPVLLVSAGTVGSVTVFAVCAAVIGATVLIVLAVDLRAWRIWSLLRTPELVGILVILVLAVIGREIPWVWLLAVAAAAVLCGGAIMRRSAATQKTLHQVRES